MIAKPYSLVAPLSATQIAQLNEMVDLLFVSAGLAQPYDVSSVTPEGVDRIGELVRLLFDAQGVAQPHVLGWPLDDGQVSQLDEMLQILFENAA